jgi:protein ImuB
MFACLHGTGNLTALAMEFSPTVEATGANTVTFDVAGLDRLFGLPQDVAAAIARRARECGVKANLALAGNPDAAICAARGFSGVSLIPHGDEGKFLARLPLALLSPDPKLLETLERWGIRRFHEMAALPPLGIAERLGTEGLRLRELARGEGDRKLLPLTEALHFEDEIELDYPVELLEPLAFLLARLINGLATRLATRGLATDELRLRLKLEPAGAHERTLRLPVPSLDTKAFLKLLQLDLEAHPPAAPVIHLWMGVNPVKPQAAQTGLFVPVAPEPVKLELTLARIQAFVGEGRVGTPELLDTHRPDAFRINSWGRSTAAPLRPAPSTRLALRLFRPRRAARVAIAGSRPSFVMADGVRGKVLDLAGPWRTSGDWWTPDPWHRDEWDIALSDGALYRIYCDPAGWFVEGSYD